MIKYIMLMALLVGCGSSNSRDVVSIKAVISHTSVISEWVCISGDVTYFSGADDPMYRFWRCGNWGSSGDTLKVGIREARRHD